MSCNTCSLWLLRRETRYDNEIIVNWSDPQGRGRCRGATLSGTLTAAHFMCSDYTAGEPIVEIHEKSGEPWHYWRPGPCPDCKKPGCGFPDCNNPNCPGQDACIGFGSTEYGIDNHCCGTGRVRYYDDGFIGENRTCMHPKEKELGKRHESPLICPKCTRGIDAAWVMCPFCGQGLKDSPPDVVQVKEIL